MPYADPEKAKQWQRTAIKNGYGKLIYQTRKRHFDNERVLRAAVGRAVELLTEADDAAEPRLRELLAETEGVLAQALVDAPPVTRGPKGRPGWAHKKEPG